jgi:hypothetical protein
MNRVLAALQAARLSILALALAFIVPVVALAQVATTDAPSPDNLSAFLAAFVAAPVVGKAVLLVILVVWALRKWGTQLPGVGPFLGTSEGGALLAMLTAVVGYIGAAYFGGIAVTWSLVWKALTAGFLAIGGWTGGRRLLRLLVPVVAKIPGIGLQLAQLLTWLAGEPAAVQVQKAAEAAYKPGPIPSAADAAAELGNPPAP